MGDILNNISKCCSIVWPLCDAVSGIKLTPVARSLLRNMLMSQYLISVRISVGQSMFQVWLFLIL